MSLAAYSICASFSSVPQTDENGLRVSSPNANSGNGKITPTGLSSTSVINWCPITVAADPLQIHHEKYLKHGIIFAKN